VVYFRSKGSLWGSLSPKKDTLMTYRTYLIRKTPTSSYLFRIKIPIDLRDFFGGRTQFKVSLGTGIKSQSLVISSTVYTEVQSIFQSVRMGLESTITISQIQEILREKVERTLLHTQHVVTDTNTFVESQVQKRLKEIEEEEEVLKSQIEDNYEKVLEHIEKEIQGVVRRKDLSIDTKSLEFKQLRKQFLELRLKRNTWKRELLTDVTQRDIRLN
jgi:hypothetical protein